MIIYFDNLENQNLFKNTKVKLIKLYVCTYVYTYHMFYQCIYVY